MFNYLLISFIIVSGMIVSIITRKLTVAAALVGGVIGLLLFIGTGFTGVGMMAAFFLLGTLATPWKRDYKQSHQLADTNQGRRDATQVIANAGVPAIVSLLIILFPADRELLQIMIGASFASATADTISSELGNVYGSRFYNVISFKKDKKGLDGVISLEGTLFGIAGSIVIALISTTAYHSCTTMIIVIIAGTIGNLADSVIGATLERKHLLNNNAVNFANTLIGAIAALLIQLSIT